VVKGRALPDVCDGQKPVQRRILYLSWSRAVRAWAWGAAAHPVQHGPHGPGLQRAHGGGAKPVKSARVVGDVLGRFHPHGDQAAYDALVRMAQDFAQRYPLIDGQGNFGSRDGDGAAAMRYTEARLSPHHQPAARRDRRRHGRFHAQLRRQHRRARQLPARLPFALLNGASGIAVGLATEIPSHNLREVADACVALIKNAIAEPTTSCWPLVPGPDYPGGGQIISSPGDMPTPTAPAAAA
jgi:topoisomerase-4 subunit A